MDSWKRGTGGHKDAAEMREWQSRPGGDRIWSNVTLVGNWRSTRGRRDVVGTRGSSLDQEDKFLAELDLTLAALRRDACVGNGAKFPADCVTESRVHDRQEPWHDSCRF